MGGSTITREQILKDISTILFEDELQDYEVTFEDIWNEAKKTKPNIGEDAVRNRILNMVKKGLLQSRNIKLDGMRRKAYRYIQEGNNDIDGQKGKKTNS